MFCILFSIMGAAVEIKSQRAHKDAHLFRLYFLFCHVLCFLFHFNAQAEYGVCYMARFDFTYSILDYWFRVYFVTATYVDYLMFSHLNLTTSPTPRPNVTQTIGATARNPNYWGSRVYPTIGAAARNPYYRGCRTQP
jgi:hypothetical protein